MAIGASQGSVSPSHESEVFSEASQPEVASATVDVEEEPQHQDSVNADGSGEGDEDEDDKLFSKVQKLMEKTMSSQDNPNINALHALSSIMETEESRYMEETGHCSLNNGRASHTIGRVGTLIRENDEFVELISSKFLSETRYPIPVQAAATRLLLSCSLTWMNPHIFEFEDNIQENIERWAMNETVFPSVFHYPKHDLKGEKCSDSEMLRTYSTGLLAFCLTGGKVLEDALTSGLSAKLMRFLRSFVLGETSISQKDASYSVVNKTTLSVSTSRGKEDGRTKVRHVLESTQLDDPRKIDEEPAGNLKDHGSCICKHVHEEDRWVDGEEQLDCLNIGVDSYDAGEDGQHFCGGNMKSGNFDESARDDLRHRVNRSCVRFKEKGQVTEGIMKNEHAFDIPLSGCGLCHGQSIKDNGPLKIKKLADASKSPGCAFGSGVEKEDYDDRFQEFIVGTKDISDLIKDAVRAAEAEARAACAPEDAIKAAGDAAFEVVKCAALEEFQSTNDEEAAFLAASRAASTVIDASSAVEVSRSSNCMIAESNSNVMELQETEAEDFFFPNSDSLAQIREKYCIQCLAILGEYVEVLGPVLHEKGVDVCLALLQRSSRHLPASMDAMLLPDVLKLISVLAAHRKFAALFVDKGGIQRLLVVPRVAQTFCGLSSCLFTIGSLLGIMERVCALPPEVVFQVVELALQLHMCPQDQARKNAALFFGAAFVFRAVIESFDAQDGLQKLLALLHDAASVRSGVTSGAFGLSTAAGSLRNDRSPAEVLTSWEKQIAYHTCVALRQYFRAHLLVLVDSIRPSKNSRSAYRNTQIARAMYKPLDISNEAIDEILLQLQKDRKLGPAFAKANWECVEKFFSYNGHITMLELCQAPPVERYLRDLLQYALGILHIVTLGPHGRKLIVSATLSNERVGIAVILDAANCASYSEHEISQQALNVLVNLVCPPPSISNKPPLFAQSQQLSTQSLVLPTVENRDKNVDKNIPDRVISVPSHSESRVCNIESTLVRPSSSSNAQTPVSTVMSGLVGDRRICLGVSGLAAQLEQGFRYAREAVRANNGIKVLLHLLQPRIVSPPAALDCLRALACRVLLGLARDDTIAHILTKLQVGKRLSELLRDSDNQTFGTEHGRWQAELAQVAIELIGIVTNSGRASTLAATDAATPTLRRIERAAIAAATPITYHSRDLLLLMHEHLQASGLAATAATLVKEAQIAPLPSLSAPLSLAHQGSVQENAPCPIQWPSGRLPGGFLSNKFKIAAADEVFPSTAKFESCPSSSKKKHLVFSSNLSFQARNHPQSHDSLTPLHTNLNKPSVLLPFAEASKANVEIDKSPIILPLKRKLMESKDCSGKRFKDGGDLGFRSPPPPFSLAVRKTGSVSEAIGFSTPRVVTPRDNMDDNHCGCNKTAAQIMDPPPQPISSLNHANNTERLTLDSLVVQYLKHQHRQCPAPITTLPPLSLLHPHVCPEPRRNLDAPSNVTARLGTRETRTMCGQQRDRQLVYSRFRPWRTCRGDDCVLLTCLAFLGNSTRIAVGSHTGELRVYDSDANNPSEGFTSHQSHCILVQSCLSVDTQLILSSSVKDVLLWNASSISTGPLHTVQGCKLGRFSNSGTVFACLPTEQPPRREIRLYDVQTAQLESTLLDTPSISPGFGRGLAYSHLHFSPSDSMVLWNGVLWDRRSSGPVHRFDQFTDYGGGGFHPAGNEVIINSEVWDLRKLRLLRSVPSLDQTSITFNSRGDIIYAILRRNLEDTTSAMHTRRVKHPLCPAFRTLDAISYSDISTTPVDRCVLDFATEPTDSFVGLVTVDDQEEMFSSARVYEIGRRRPTDDDSDPDDAESEDDEEDDDDEEDVNEILDGDTDEDDDDDDDVDDVLGNGLDGANDGDDDGEDDDDDDDDDSEGGLFRILSEAGDDVHDEDSDMVASFSSGDDEDFRF